jgi:hypothetical protein
MSRRSVLLGLGILVLLAGIVVGVLYLLVRHEPEHYRRLALPPGPERKQLADQFYAEFFELINGIANHQWWDVEFTEEQINSYLDDTFITSNVSDRSLPRGVREPRVALEPGHIRLFFRYGAEPWQTVVSINLKVWLPREEPNVVALELESMRAGALPLVGHSLRDLIAECAQRNDIGITWYRRQSNPVAVLRFQTSPRPTVQLQRLEVTQGKLRIAGRSLDDNPLRAE